MSSHDCKISSTWIVQLPLENVLFLKNFLAQCVQYIGSCCCGLISFSKSQMKSRTLLSCLSSLPSPMILYLQICGCCCGSIRDAYCHWSKKVWQKSNRAKIVRLWFTARFNTFTLSVWYLAKTMIFFWIFS